MDAQRRPAHHVRTAFLSDIHLGARECRADLVLRFLHEVQMDELWLVGDIVDVWSLKRSFHWPQLHNNVLRTILGKAKHGTRVVYVPGNHDEVMRDMVAMVFGNLEVQREGLHVTADGRRMLVVHGDEFDASVKFSRWLAALGSHAYDVALGLNRGYNRMRRACGYPYWSLASYLKSRIGSAVRYVERFEQAAAHCAARRGLDGVICGHIHRPVMRELHGVQYCNTGDWVDNCTALVEDRSGELRLWQLADWAVSDDREAAQLRAA
jgi:UDP-2,3-diacylglucosamine pyrophosphatase LpxH